MKRYNPSTHKCFNYSTKKVVKSERQEDDKFNSVITASLRNENNSYKILTHKLTCLPPNLKTAFTLAEVLVTLGIIGIVAALTLPPLVQNYKKREVSTRLKRFYSMMNQAIILSESVNGPIETWEHSVIFYDENGNRDYAGNHNLGNIFIRNYILPYIKYTNFTDGFYDKETSQGIGTMSNLYLTDGTVVSFWNSSCIDTVVDTNGNKKPNIIGKDIYIFSLCTDETRYLKGKHFGPYVDSNNTSREKALENCKSNPSYCSGLLQMDNWEFKDDYPYKL